jgi:hypothetical protein
LGGFFGDYSDNDTTCRRGCAVFGGFGERAAETAADLSSFLYFSSGEVSKSKAAIIKYAAILFNNFIINVLRKV